MDPLELRNYEEEEFLQPDMQPMLPPQPGRDVFGKADPYRAYMDEFDEPAGKEEHNVVIIPRYAGPKNTRCDKYKQSGSQYRITGLTSHLQHSSVYLHQTFSFNTSIITFDDLPKFYVPPFFIQRSWNKLLFGAPQSNNTFEMDSQMHVKLAPYLTSKQCLDNFVKTKMSATRLQGPPDPDGEGDDDEPTNQYEVTDEAGNVGTAYDYEITVEAYEPLLGFQSGWADLDCVRPFNQQHKKFPLALQDYELQIRKKPFRIERVLKHRVSCMNDDCIFEAVNLPDAEISNEIDNLSSDPRMRIVQFKNPDSATLVSFSDDSANQANKTVSTVQLHAPYIFAHRKKFVFTQNEADREAFKANTERQSKELIVGEAGTPDKMTLRVETSKGLPSYFVFYLEDFGPNAHIEGENGLGREAWYDATSALNNRPAYDRNTLGACHPKVTGLRIRVHGDDFPLTAQLGKEEIEYLTQKNSHKYCDFRRLMTSDPIVLLKLEDLGLANCQMGYPAAKRMILEFEVTKVMFPAAIGSTWYSDPFLERNPTVEFSVGMVYENHVLEGNTNRVEFLWR